LTGHTTDLASFDWSMLHDAVLVTAAVGWEDGTADLVLNLPTPPRRQLRIHADGLSWFCCPREQPWGRSVHVNGANAVLPEPGQRAEIRVEMQSGDVLEVRADHISVEVIETHDAAGRT
jgi:hypothetical protein